MPTAAARWYFDFISPFSYLQLHKVHQWRERLDITPVPIAFGAVLAHNGNLGPAEIPGRREFTYRFVQWQAETAGIALRFPPAHPFNPLAALRLCIAAGTSWESIEAIFNHLWRDGRSGADAAELAAIARALNIDNVENAINAAEVKTSLRANTDAAIATRVFGVPTLRVGDELFWSNDATPMIEDWLARPDRFAGTEYRRIADLPVGIRRQR
ncbi:MAG: 2-hydroxychromene-2-carboxylate isomerase [Rudaea sp.]|nr:2-hydroxychromene-2-carboxylate isomerase [Rudaea sp.]